MSQTLFQTTKSTASFSDCGKYRYSLLRVWDDTLPVVAFIMLNPSTADASTDDATIRKCMGFARRWGNGGIAVVNLFAWRETDSSLLPKVSHPVAPPPPDGEHPLYDNINDAFIVSVTDGRRVIAAWGCGGVHGGRDKAVLKLLRSRRIEALKLSKDGHPWHPLYVSYEAKPITFSDPS